MSFSLCSLSISLTPSLPKVCEGASFENVLVVYRGMQSHPSPLDFLQKTVVFQSDFNALEGGPNYD